MSKPTTTVQRVTIGLRAPDDENLRFIAEHTRLSENDSIRKALVTERFIQDEIAKGSTILAMDAEGAIRHVIFV